MGPEDAAGPSRAIPATSHAATSGGSSAFLSAPAAVGASSRRKSVDGSVSATATASGYSATTSRRSPAAAAVIANSKYLTEGSRSSSRRGSTVGQELHTAKPKKSFSYWMQMTWNPESLQELLMSHPSVDDCTVQDFNIDGIGSLPRAYVVMKSGYSASSDELLQFVDSRVNEASKLRGGIVFVDKLSRDPSGKLFISLEKFNKDAEGMDYGIIRGQPKVKISQE